MDIFYPLQWIADRITYDLIGLSPESRLGAAVDFFFYDVPKILLLLSVIIFVVALIRSYFPPEKTRKYLSHSREYVGNVLAAALGVVTPFCSCSAVPLFIGFVEAGVPLGVTFSFLIASPMVNEVALILLLGMFGWKVAGLYLVSGLIVAITGGIILGRLGLDDQIEEYVLKIRMGQAEIPTMTRAARFSYARGYVAEIVGKVWLYVVIGIAIGGFMHGFIPSDALAAYAGPDNPLAVPVAVAMGIPLYSNAAGVIPIVSVLVDKGVAMGTVLAFMMAVTALSIPEFVILRKVMKPKLIGIFIAINFVTITFTGYLFNWAIPLLMR
ncbi:MAG: permease [Actinobacteria bacterium]|nr:permease [Actinomycetota bacterium]MCG2808378.1 permease [Coriobacteriia bacterium]